MKLEFESIEEVKEFVTKLKGTRGGKADKDDETASTGAAPAPLAPPVGGPGPTFNPAMPSAFPAPASAFPAPAGPSPEVLALVTRVNAKIDSAIGGGQPAEQVTQWFRGECQKAGLDAASATLDQIKTVFLPKMTVPMLEGIAKLMNA